MNIFLSFIIFLFGLMVGSFLNCVIYRLETKQSFLKGRSFCPYCKHKLSWLDLIPLFSFIFLKGKCRYCQKKISWQYPLVEIATGFLFVLSLSIVLILSAAAPNLRIVSLIFSFPLFFFLVFYWVFISFLILIFVYDLKHFIIPDKVIFPIIAIAFLYQLFGILFLPCSEASKIAGLPGFIRIFGPAIGASAFFLAIFLISRGKWIGFGDVKLGFLMGLLLGWPNIIPALFISFLLGAIIGIGLIIAKKKNLKSEIPFGPFLVTGTLISLFFGQRLIEWYLGLFL